MEITKVIPPTTRRRFLGSQAGRIAKAFSAAAAVDLTARQWLRAQKNSSPDAALQELVAGNKRFVSRQMTSCKQDVAALRHNTIDKQTPFAAVLSCADSRVPVEIVFDQNIGRLFVTRVAGNIITPEIVGSLEYGVAELGAQAILVMGHANCGAVKAAMHGETAPGQISTLYARIQPAVDQAQSNLDAAIKANAKIQSDLLRKSSTVISGLLKERKLKVVAAYYDLGGGGVTFLD